MAVHIGKARFEYVATRLLSVVYFSGAALPAKKAEKGHYWGQVGLRSSWQTYNSRRITSTRGLGKLGPNSREVRLGVPLFCSPKRGREGHPAGGPSKAWNGPTQSLATRRRLQLPMAEPTVRCPERGLLESPLHACPQPSRPCLTWPCFPRIWRVHDITKSISLQVLCEGGGGLGRLREGVGHM